MRSGRRAERLAALREPVGREGGWGAWITSLGLLMVLGILQVSDAAVWGGVRTDPTLALAVSWALVSGPRHGLVFGVAAGLVQDLLLGQSFLYTGLRALLGLGAGLARPLLNVQQPLVILPVVLLASMLQDLVVVAILGAWTRWAALWPWRLLADLAVSVPIFLVARRLWSPAGGWTVGGRSG
ncbi:MAG: hypothetical protein VKO21_05295 [Candidatus Sericytochromatia bacterium]|nr:hypothetical protein [Candidatus Sericytochromatia bacterium]